MYFAEKLHRNIEQIDCALVQTDAYIIDADLCRKKYYALCFKPSSGKNIFN